MKVCSSCIKKKSNAEFDKDPKARTGRKNDCKACLIEHNKERYKLRKILRLKKRRAKKTGGIEATSSSVGSAGNRTGDFLDDITHGNVKCADQPGPGGKKRPLKTKVVKFFEIYFVCPECGYKNCLNI